MTKRQAVQLLLAWDLAVFAWRKTRSIAKDASSDKDYYNSLAKLYKEIRIVEGIEEYGFISNHPLGSSPGIVAYGG